MPDERTSKEIDKLMQRVLKEAGIVEPPVRIEDLLTHLDLHRDFYSLEDPTLLQRLWHKVRVEGHRLKQVVNKIKLAAIWLPDERRILVDKDLPSPKQTWASFHDCTHRILPWHRGFFLGETAQTLHPDYQEALENEANYGASALRFLGPLFTQEALQTPPEWASVDRLKRRYHTSWQATLRRYVEYSHDQPMALLVSSPLWLETSDGQEKRSRHFIVSKRFEARFHSVSGDDVLFAVDTNARQTRGGPAGSFGIMLKDVNGKAHEFYCESFFNQHDLLTFLVHKQELGKTVVICPKRFRM